MRARREHPDAFHGTPRSQAQPNLPHTQKAPPAFRFGEELYHLLYEDIPAMYFTLDCQGIVLSVNRFGADQLGYVTEELTGRSVLAVFHDDDRQAVQCQLALLLEQPGQARRWQLRKVRKDGTVMWVEEDARAVRREDGSLMVLVVCYDISDHKQVEEELRESRQQYKLIVDHATDIIYRTDARGHFTFVNPTAMRLMGCTEPELLGHRFTEFIRPDYRARAERFYGLQFVRKTPATYFEFPAVTKNGHVLWLGQNVQVLCENGLVVGFQAVTRDITERKRAEDALAESEKRLKAILETEPECVKVVTAGGILLDMNAAGLAMIEADSLEDVRGRSVFPIIAPAHRNAFAEFIRDVHAGKPGVIQFEIVGLKGRHRWMETHAVPLRDERNVSIGVLAVTRDITDRKRTEQALQESEERFRLLFEHATIPMTLTDHEKRFVKVNRAYCLLTGYEEQDLLGRTYEIMTDPDDLPNNLAVADQVLAGKHSTFYYLEKRYARKDGTQLWVAETASRLTLPESDTPFVLAFIQDITQRKRTEEALQSARQEREQLARNLHDNIIQAIYAIGLTVEESQSLARTSPTGATRKLDQVVASLNRVIREVRGYLAVPVEEQPETLSVDELISSFEHLGRLMEHADGVRFAMEIAADAARALTGSQRAQFLYVAQEAMSNSLRHSSSSTARVSLARTARGVRLEIRDNGVGFSLSRIRNGSGGLKNIRLRARKIGANLDIASHPMGGTVVSMEIQAST